MTPLLPCLAHNLPVALGFDGVHYISCAEGCEMHDGENLKPTELIQRWNEMNL